MVTVAGRWWCCSLGAGVLAIAGAPAVAPVAVSPAVLPAPEVRLADTEAWIMGFSGTPIPSADYLDAVSQRFLDPGSALFAGQPLFPVDTLHALFTPEGLYPTSGIKGLTLDASVAQGVKILDTTISDRVGTGHDVVVVGGSQSSTIASLAMRDLLELPSAERPSADELSFVLLGDPSNPNGGLLERFGDPSLPPLTLPSLGITFSGATPADAPWDTAIYTGEYDGMADFPSYPINLLADINALLGVLFVHTSYPSLTDEQMATAIELPVSDDAGATEYFMFPTETLPLLQPLLSIPVIGRPLYDLLEPDLRILVNLGYGDIDHGWDPGPADVPTPFGLFPDVDLGEVLTALGDGAREGWDAFVGDLSSPDGAPFGADAAGFIDAVNAFSGWLASAYAVLLPTADILNALVTTLPAYDVELFFHELAAGNLLEAIGLPIAADLGLGSVALGFEFEAIAG